MQGRQGCSCFYFTNYQLLKLSFIKEVCLSIYNYNNFCVVPRSAQYVRIFFNQSNANISFTIPVNHQLLLFYHYNNYNNLVKNSKEISKVAKRLEELLKKRDDIYKRENLASIAILSKFSACIGCPKQS